MIRKTPWKLDPRWTRCESLDDQHRPVGFTYFEPGSNPPPTDVKLPAGDTRKIAARVALAATFLVLSLLVVVMHFVLR